MANRLVIPSGSFVAVGPKFVFDGAINNLGMVLTVREGRSRSFTFNLQVEGMAPSIIDNPLTVQLSVAEDQGLAQIPLRGNLHGTTN